MRIIGYVRLSRASREESTSIVRQRELIAQTCTLRDDFELIDLVEDVDVSATRSRLDRPGLNKVREMVRRGDADAVMVWRLDRLVRSVVDVGVLLDEGLQIISATENLDTTSAMGRAMIEILQVFASMEAKTIGVRVAASQERLRNNGRWPGGVVPYGYRSVPHPTGAGRALEPEPFEARIVRRMADEVLAGSPVFAVTARLNADGVPTRRPIKNDDGTESRRDWSPTSVQRILRSDAVLGRVRLGGIHKRSGRKTTTTKKAEPLRDELGIPVSVWPPLLSVEEVERLRELTDWKPIPGRSEATRQGRRQRRTRLLSGLLSCPTCGHELVAKSRRSTTGEDIYTCNAKSRGLVCECGVAVECYRIEAEVERQFLGAYGRLRLVEPSTIIREVAGLAAVQEAIRDTTDRLRDPDADVPTLVDRLTDLRRERERLEAVPERPVVVMVDAGMTVEEAWADRDVTLRREIIEASGVSITLAHAAQRGRWDPARVSVEFPIGYLTERDFAS
ncbi:recombinase family protein [Subtercola boreus]|uniref:recombinase family protein n=1 Tax=Subtercola boreus TaxID=120213 RepID=UPI0015591875|nr:recombinase family protein [Subtercola boreus]